MAIGHRSDDGILTRVSFPLYAVQMVTERHLLVAGGGGSVKTGVANCIELYELVKCSKTNTCRSIRVARFDTGERAVMNATVFHNGKHYVLATGGMNGTCVLYQMRLVAQSETKNKPEKMANGNGHLSHTNGDLRKRHTQHLGGDETSSLSNGHTSHAHSNGSPPQSPDEQDYPELTFEIKQMTSFQADFNTKRTEESYLKVIKFSATSRILVTGGSDGCLRIFGYPSLQLMATITAHEHDVDDLDIDPTGAKIVSISKDGHGYIWNVKSRTKLGELQLHPTAGSHGAPAVKYMFRACRFSAVERDSNQVVLFTAVNPLVRSKPPAPSYLCKWDVNRFGLLKTSAPVKDVFSTMAISDDGRFIGAGYLSGSVDVFIAFSLQKLYSVKTAHSIFVTQVDFLSTSDETKMLTGSHDATLVSISVDNQVIVHHVPSQTKIGIFSMSLLLILVLLCTFIMFDVLGL